MKSASTLHFSVQRYQLLMQRLGPGILMATAAIGGSHLVASTQAGAKFGWQLALLILAVNLFKYPFFRAGISYTLATNQTLQTGYASLGKPYLLTSFILNGLVSFVNSAALLLFSSSLLNLLLPWQLPITVIAFGLLAMMLTILIAGHYKMLNRVAKMIMFILVIATLTATAIAWHQGPVAPADFISPSPWNLAAIGFLVVTMGWMPAPIEVSGFTSLWLKQQSEKQPISAKSALFDFNLGYALTLILALVFLALGALLMHGSEESFASGGFGFSQQLVNLYASTIGEWSRFLIAIIAFLCIFGSAITVYDGYARALAECHTLLRGKKSTSNAVYLGWLFWISILSMAVIVFFQSTLLAMLGFAMTLAFITTPMFAWLNHTLVRRAAIPATLNGGITLLWLSRAGLVYLFGFLAVFVMWKWIL